MTTNSLVEETERELRVLAAQLSAPRAAECLLCYVRRMLEDFGCDTRMRWARRYRDLRAPRATALERRLGQVGGFCDCEIFLNGYEFAQELYVPPRWYVEDGISYETDPVPPDPLPACRGARAGSTRSCSVWVRQGTFAWPEPWP